MAGEENGGKGERNIGFYPYLETLSIFTSIVEGIVADRELFPIDNPGLRQALIAELAQRVYRAQGRLFPELSQEDLVRVTKTYVKIILSSITEEIRREFEESEKIELFIDYLMYIYEGQIQSAKKRKA